MTEHDERPPAPFALQAGQLGAEACSTDDVEDAIQSAFDGWIPYDGSGMPVHRDVVIDAKLRDGKIVEDKLADEFTWHHMPHYSDIIAYRIAKAAADTAATPDRRFEFLLNAFEPASQSAHPSANGYLEKRRALIDFVANVQRKNEELRTTVDNFAPFCNKLSQAVDDWERRARKEMTRAETAERENEELHRDLKLQEDYNAGQVQISMFNIKAKETAECELAATQSARDQWMAQYTESNAELMRMRSAREEEASSWEKLLLEFEDFINEPPQYEEMFRVREYRHELYPKWRIVSNAALALLAAKQSRIDELEKELGK